MRKLTFKKSRLLLLTLLAILGRVNSAWAAAYTCGFEASEGWSTEKINYVNYTTVGTNWGCIGGTTLAYHDLTSYKRTGSNGLTCDYENTNKYAVTPYLAAGTIRFYARYTQSTYYLKIYKASFDGQNYSVEDAICDWNKNGTKLTNSFTEYSFELDEDSYVAILLDRVTLDDFSAPNGTTTPSGIAKPKSFTVSNVTSSSADFSWVAGSTETHWEFSYSTTSGAPDNGTIIPLTETSYSLFGLTAENTYYASVRAKINDEYSAWSKEISFTPTRAVKLTVNDGTSTNSYVPIYGNYVDYYDKVEFVIPASDLADMANSDIKAIQFYMSTVASASWGTANFKIYMKEVDYTTISSYTFTDDDTPLYNGSIDGTKADMAVTLSSAYHYNGGNLLIGVYNTVKGTYKSASFYGVSATSGASAYGTNSTSLASVTSVNKQSFLPKTTFTYLPADGPIMKVSESSFDFGTITAESTASDKTKTLTISNTGTATLEGITVSYTGDDVFSTSPAISAQSIAVNGDAITVTVTMATETPGDYNGTITVSATDQTPVEIAVSGTYAANPATMAITFGEETVGQIVAFGNVGKQATKTFTVTNTGNLKLNITSIVSNNTTDFTVSPATLEVAGGSSETFTVTFVYPNENPVLNEEKTANITVTASNEGINPVTFDVTGTRVEMWSEDFSGNALPEGWETTSTTYWTFNNGYAAAGNNATSYYLITPSLTVEAGQTLNFDVMMSETMYTTMTVEKQKGNDSWTEVMDINKAALDNAVNVWKTFTIDGLEAGNYKFRFNARGFHLDNFEGFKLNNNDPKLGIYTDAQCTVAATTAETKDFGFVTTDQTATYYIKNDGTGTMTMTKGSDPTGFTATLDKTSVAAGEHATLTITMAATNEGYNHGDLVVTATGLGTFTVALSGVAMDTDKNYVNFASTEAKVPAGWTNNSWTVTANANGYIYSGSSSNDLVSCELEVTDGDKLIISASGNSNDYYSPASLAVSYSADGGEWTQAANVSSQLTSTSVWKTIEIDGIPTTAKYIKFTGAYAYIQRIYGFSLPKVPIMTTTAADIAFGMQTAESTEQSFTISNEGTAKLEGLSVTLGKTGANAEFEIRMTKDDAAFTGTEIEAGETVTVYVKQLFNTNYGAKSDVLTIAATGQTSVSINLTGTTRDGSKLYVDFDNPNSWPDGWTHGSGWTIYSWGTDRYAYQSASTTSAFVTTPLTVAENEKLTFHAGKYGSGTTSLSVRYTSDGGVTWSDYTSYTVSSTTLANYELDNVPAGTVVVEFFGKYVKIDNIQGFTPTTAPMLALTEGGNAVANGDIKEFGNLTTDGVATYTLTNNGTANMVSTVHTTGWATAVFSGEGEGVTLDKVNSSETYNKVTLEPGKSATLTLTMPFGTSYGDFTGTMVVETEGWVGDMTVNYTATLIDPTAVNETFANNTKPEGFYSNGWTYSSGYAANSNPSEAEFITSKLTVSGDNDIITYAARAAYDGNYGQTLTVSYSKDRVTWIDVATLGENDLTATFQTFQVSGLEADDYYLRFTGARVYVDNILGWHYATPVAEHDLYIPTVTYPSADGLMTPGSEITVTATVASLRANEDGVYTKLYYRDADHENTLVELATSTSASISKDGTQTFTMTANMPATESHYRLSVGAFLSNGTELFHTGKSAALYHVAHTRTLAVTDFALTSDATVTADANNQFTSTFNVTVRNNGTVDQPASNVSVTLTDADGNAYGSATTWTAANSQTVFITPGDYATADAVLAIYRWNDGDTDEQKEWARLTKISDNFYSAELNGKGKFIIVRLKPSTEENYDSSNDGLNWNNKWNQSVDITTGSANSFSFNGWDDKNGDNNHYFAYSTMSELAQGVSTTLKVTVTTSAQEGGEFTFKAKENLSNTVYATAQTVNVTANAPRFAMYESGNAVTAGDDFNYGVVQAPATVAKTFTITNEGNAPLVITGYSYPLGYTVSPAFPNNGETIAAGESKSYTMTLNPASVDYTSIVDGYLVIDGNFSVNYTVDNTAKTFSAHFSGRAVAADTWMETFDSNIPVSWTNNGWEWNSDRKAAYSTYTAGKTLMTPRLAAENGAKLTFDVIFPYSGEQLKVQYSTDKTTWNDVATYNSTANNQTIEGSFTAPAAGNYYLKFGDSNSRYVYVDNFIGFELNPLEHDTEITASNVPTTGTQYGDYIATVSLKENAGKNETLTSVKLYVDGTDVNATADVATATANATTVVTLTWTPQTTVDNKKAYIEVVYAGGTLTTDEVDLTIAAPYELSETVDYSSGVTCDDYDVIVLNRKFVAGWNTVCLPFDVSVTEIHSGAVAYSFDAYNTTTKELTFNKVTTLSASIPYVVYVPEAVNDPYVFKNKKITSTNNTAFYSNHDPIRFQGNYAPVDFSTISETCYGLTATGKIAKIKSTAKMNGFRAYFTGIPAGARVSFFDDEVPTGIRAIEIDTTAPEGTYNLQGQKVDQLNRSGLYIINGKKVVVK